MQGCLGHIKDNNENCPMRIIQNQWKDMKWVDGVFKLIVLKAHSSFHCGGQIVGTKWIWDTTLECSCSLPDKT